ncbi:helix-turn-helix transcriptional regulator [Pseudomonas azotifigens]|uniref:Helix-turn-helix transcriptional regulator n=2 Tax=Stutzerimonas azotifigens TaxID=291995 RepID=A0ABR5Z759_9GAMM|nr:helix-turn-helix transcriptional regulator [Stutzerimonas azotifigens]
MVNTLHGRNYEQTELGPRLKPCAPHDVLSRMGDKWTILTLLLLAIAPGHRLRFSAIKNGIEGITQRMLTVTLRHLERDGFLVRHYFPEVPPRVEYELTDMGSSLLPALEGFTGWIREHWPLIEEARRTFDEEHHRRAGGK